MNNDQGWGEVLLLTLVLIIVIAAVFGFGGLVEQLFTGSIGDFLS